MSEHVWTPRAHHAPLKATGEAVYLGVGADEWAVTGCREFYPALLDETLRLAALVEALEAVVAPLLPLFRERFEAWEAAAHGEAPTWAPDTITLTAEFPTAALRALAKEEE